MAFKGAQDNSGQLIQLAMLLMDRKRQAEQDKMSMQQNALKTAQELAKFQLDRRKAELDIAKGEAELRTQYSDQAASLAPLADAASKPVPASVMAMPVEQRQRALAGQQAAADAFVSGLNTIGASRQVMLGEDTRSAAVAAGTEANPSTIAARAKARQADAVAQETRAERREREREDRIRIQNEEADAKARERGVWDRKDLVSWNDRNAKLFAPAEKTNEDWNALEKARKGGTAQQYLEIVQRWVRNVDEGATVREGDIDLVQYFGMSDLESLRAWAAGSTDAEAKVPAKAKQAIQDSFEQLLTERTRTITDRWSDMTDYADGQNWNDAERSTALPRSRAVRRLFTRQQEAMVGDIQVPPGMRTDAAYEEANRRVMRRFGFTRPDQVSPQEAMLELKSMYAEAIGGGM